MSADLLLENADCTVRVDAANGGRLASLRVYGHELLLTAGADALSWGSYPLAPWAGRLRDGRFRHAGTDYRVPLNFGAHAIHGTVFSRAWTRVDANTIATGLGSDWPFAGLALQQFELHGARLRVRLEIRSAGAAFPASAGFHPWFRRRLDRGAEAELQFRAGRRFLTDAAGIPTGELGACGEPPWDDCFVGVDPDPCLRWPGVLGLRLQSSHAHWVVYSRPAHALCVEPWSAAPDALNGACALVTPDAPLVLEMNLSWFPDTGFGE